MTLGRLWLFLGIALPVLAAVLAPMSTVDLSYHLRAGAETLDTGAIPRADTWTYTVAGEPWLNQQWGAQVVFALTERLGGWTAIVLLRAALTAAIFTSLTVIVRRRGHGPRTTALLVIVAFAIAAPAMAMRPQLLGLACFAVLLVLIDLRRDRPRALLLAPLVILAWANAHGSFFLGVGALGLAWLADLYDRDPGARRTFAVTVAAAVAACITPFGPMVWVYAAGLSSNSQVRELVTEWQTTSPLTVPGFLFYASLLGVAALLIRRGRATPWPMLLWLAAFAILGAYAERGIAWWALAAIGPVATLLASGAPQPAPERTTPPTMRRLNAILAGVVIVAGVALLPVWRPLDPGTLTPANLLTHAPSGITGALRETLRPGDRLFHPQVWGSWFETTFPEALVAVDSRIELFPEEVWDAHMLVLGSGDGWQEQLDTWGVTVAVVGSGDGDQDLADRMVDAGWEIVFQDQDGSVLRPT